MSQTRTSTFRARALQLSAFAGIILPDLAAPEAMAEDGLQGPLGVAGSVRDEEAAEGEELSASSSGLSGKKNRRFGLGGPEQGVDAQSADSSPDVQSLLPGFPGLQGSLPFNSTLPNQGRSLLPGGTGVFPRPAPPPQRPPAPEVEAMHGPLGLGHPSSGAHAHNGGVGTHHEGTNHHAGSRAAGGGTGHHDH